MVDNVQIQRKMNVVTQEHRTAEAFVKMGYSSGHTGDEPWPQIGPMNTVQIASMEARKVGPAGWVCVERQVYIVPPLSAD